MTAVELQPTLWRTCRVLANRRRLQMIQLLLDKPGQTVTAVARALKLPLNLASQYLRALESRSLLRAKRKGRYVYYSIAAPQSASPARPLVAALRNHFQQSPHPVRQAYHLATAFTHPRRIEIYRALCNEALTTGQVRTRTRVSGRALWRHLAKLEARGLIQRQAGQWCLIRRSDALGRALMRMTV